MVTAAFNVEQIECSGIGSDFVAFIIRLTRPSTIIGIAPRTDHKAAFFFPFDPATYITAYTILLYAPRRLCVQLPASNLKALLCKPGFKAAKNLPEGIVRWYAIRQPCRKVL